MLKDRRFKHIDGEEMRQGRMFFGCDNKNNNE
jgi:hypothetical protein